MIINESEIHKRIITLRKSRGYTQSEFADAIHMTCPTVRRLETGEKSPTIRHIIEIANALHTAPEWILGEGNPSIPPEIID